MNEHTQVKLRTLFNRCDHTDGTVVTPDLDTYRYRVRALQEDHADAPDGEWGVYDFLEKQYVDPEEIETLNIDERLPLN